MNKALSLQELNGLIRNVLESNLDEEYWLQAELSEVNLNRSGHCYVEFVQKAPRANGFVAKARGVIWANTYTLLAPYFEEQTGQRFAAGLKVQVKVQVTFHEVYGYSLVVTDIDPTYTLGDLAMRRKEILQELERQGILTLNKELQLPVLPQRIAVISAPSAAGYGDFCNQLANNEKEYSFHVRLFPAVMQGEQTERSIISALNAIADDMDNWDVVVIIRGGGATADLASFDTLALAENVAQFPLPVITGIGHERDDTVLDLIAHTRVKTPTAAAEFLIARVDESGSQLANLAQRFNDVVQRILQKEQLRLERLVTKLPAAYQARKVGEEARLQRASVTLQNSAFQMVTSRHTRLQLLEQRILLVTPQLVGKQQHRLEMLAQRISDNSPERLLKRGYSITLKDGRAVTDAQQLKPGDVIVTRLAQGEVKSEIK
ncbi:MAG: exodeoxyribonuclease VII large subunit [Bacteroidaceae bacterium]|nr:exodeoxyribonuclease VII large subunit [Bacteroidaceae bacterium]